MRAGLQLAAKRRPWRDEAHEIRVLADVLSEDVGSAHAFAVACVFVESGFGAEEILCVNGYTRGGEPELSALAGRGWPLVELRETLERWAADALAEYAADERRLLLPCALCGAEEPRMYRLADSAKVCLRCVATAAGRLPS